MDRYATLRQGLVGAWCPSLGATGYTLIDRSGRNNHGTLTNMGGQTNWRASGSGVALNFDGSNDFVAVPNAIDSSYLNQSHTFSVWVNHPSVTANYPSVIKHANANNFPVGTSIDIPPATAGDGNRLYVAHGNGQNKFAIAQATTSRLNTWFHVCGVIDKSSQLLSLYINGALQGSSSISTVDTINVTGGVEMGRRVDGLAVSAFYGGLLDDARIYRRALTPAEIRLLASQRGIGLLPTRHRRGSLLSQFWLNVAGTWKTAKPWINVGGTWKVGSPKIRAGGAWKG